MQDNKSEVKLNRILSLYSLVFYGLAFMVPLTLFTTYGLAASASHGMVSLAYIITTACMLLIALSYAIMTKVFSTSGSVYTFVLHSMNPTLGFLSGWAILLGYIFLPMLNFLISAIFLSSALPFIPSWVWVVGMALIVLVINHFGIKITDIFNKSIVALQIVFLVLFFGIVIWTLFVGDKSFFDINALIRIEEFSDFSSGLKLLFAAASILALSFLGFDAIATLSEEALEPKKNIPKAIVLSCLIAGISLIVMTYILQIAWSNAWFEMKEASQNAANGHGEGTDNGDEFIYVKSDYKLIQIRLDDILYIEGLKDYVKIYLEHEPRPILSLMSLKSVEEHLPSSRFLRVHRSYIVQKSKIRLIDRGRIVFGKEYIPISDSYKQELQSYLNNKTIQ